jgi:Domain of unknown function (DUF4190)/GYF domain 2
MYKIIGADHIEYGPVTVAQLRDWIAEGRANAASLVRAEGAAEWKPISSIPELAAALAAPAKIPGVIGPTIARPPKTNGLAIAGMILGILSLMPLCFVNILMAIIGMVLSCLALSQIKKSGGQETGRGLAITGIVTSVIGLFVFLVVVLFFMAAAVGGHSN